MGLATNYRADALKGDDFDNVIYANFAAADALHTDDGAILANFITTWARSVFGKGGDDLVIRDRPGDYSSGGTLPHPSFEYDNGDWVFRGPDVAWTGNVLVHGSEGDDTISYQQFGGGIDIDLAPVAHNVEYEPWFWDQHAELAGRAMALGLSGQEIYGFDYLVGFENATGTDQNDEIRGTDQANTLKGLDGRDLIWGRDGNDRILGGDGNDGLYGDEGNDAIQGERATTACPAARATTTSRATAATTC